MVFDFEGKEFLNSAVPDGMTSDVNDKIWLACYASSQVLQIDPETGTEYFILYSAPISWAIEASWVVGVIVAYGYWTHLLLQAGQT